MPIPLALGLIGPNGDEMPTRLEGEGEARAGTRVVLADAAAQVFRFADVAAPPVPSLLRNFSAPVKLQGVPLDRLKFLAIHDTDPVARWDAGQQVATRVLLDRVAARRAGGTMPPLDPDLVAAMRQTLADADRDPAFAAEALMLPGESILADEMATVASRRSTPRARRPRGDRPGAGRPLARDLPRAGRSRPLPHRRPLDRPAGAAQCLPRLSRRRRQRGRRPARQGAVRRPGQHDRCAGGAGGAGRYRLPGTRRGADPVLRALERRPAGHRQMVRLAGPLVAARHDRGGARLAGHPAFTRANPNRVRALVGVFSQGNPLHFHAPTATATLSSPTRCWRSIQPTRRRRRGWCSRSGSGGATMRPGRR